MKRDRRAMSLMEVVIATGILFGSMVVLSQLAFLGRRYLDRAEDATTASRLCQNKLNEIIAGIEPLENVDEQLLEEDQDWKYSVTIEPLEDLSLTAVRVTVWRDPEGLPAGRRGTKPYTLVRWLRRSSGREIFSPPGLAPEASLSTQGRELAVR